MSKDILNKTDITKKLFTKLENTGWDLLLRLWILSPKFEEIIDFLLKEYELGVRFTPSFKQIFNSLIFTPLNKTNIIFVGQDPYPQLGVADGLAFSCSNKNKAEKSLLYILGAINETVYKNHKTGKQDVNLKRWSDQGVLLINTAFTCEVNEIGSHTKLWKPFSTFIFQQLNDIKDKSFIFVFLGKQAQEYNKIITNDNHVIYNISHPASAAYSKKKVWDCEDVFNKINNNLKTKNLPEILW